MKKDLSCAGNACRYDDSEFINADTVSSYANTNEHLISGKVTAIVVELPGLGGSSCLGGSINMGNYDSAFALRCAKNGILLAYMFPGPWSWGNKAAVRMTDSVVSALARKYGLGDDFPLVVCGGSMGGLGSLNYAADTAYDLAAVVSACPCVDVLDRFSASKSYPRTFISAIACYDMPLQDALKRISPVERIADMPRVPYFICSDAEDEVFPENQCDSYVEKLKAAGHHVTYYQQPGKTHGQFATEVRFQLNTFIINAALAGKPENGDYASENTEALTVSRVRQINDSQLKIEFSEPIYIKGNPFMGIRYTQPNGIGLLWRNVNGTNTPVQFHGSWEYENDTQTSVIWTVSDDVMNGYKLPTILNREDVLYGTEAPIRFCIEEIAIDSANKAVQPDPGYIFNVRALNNDSKLLVASETNADRWEGVYVEIDTQ